MMTISAEGVFWHPLSSSLAAVLLWSGGRKSQLDPEANLRLG